MCALAIDMRCLGESECGSRGKAGAIADVRAAMAELRQEGAKRVAIIGASYGGAIAVVAGAKLKPAAVVDLSGEQSLQALVPGYDDVDSLAAAPALHAPALFVVARKDNYTPVADMRRVFRAAGSRAKQLIVLPFEAGHGLAVLSGFELQVVADRGADRPLPQRWATNSACAPRATGPERSLSTDVASPAPPSAISRPRVQQHPLAHRLAQEVHGQLGVDEQVARPVEHVGGAVAGVGDDHHALARRRLLALDDRDPHARPDRRRPAARSQPPRAQRHSTACA